MPRKLLPLILLLGSGSALLTTSCSPEEPPAAKMNPKVPPSAVMPKSVTPPEEPSRPPAPEPSAPAPAPLPAPAVPAPLAKPEPPAPPKPMPPVSDRGLPTFTFRTMDHRRADVFINGEKHSTTTCLWSVTGNTEFDRQIPVPEWPPEHARFAAAGDRRRQEDPASILSSAEIYLTPYSEESRARYPHLQPGEHVLYFRAEVKKVEIARGAIRIKVCRGDKVYRHTDYQPMNSESEQAMHFVRTIWFDYPWDD